MNIVFSGICCFVDAQPPKTGKTVVVRNALRGGTHSGNSIPPHMAFLHVKRNQVDLNNWGSGWLASEDNILLWLTGDYLTIEPLPTDGSIDISGLPHVLLPGTSEPICPAADELRPQILASPAASNVLALIDLPSGASITCGVSDFGAAHAILQIRSAPVTITATPFEPGLTEKRSMLITDPDAHVFITNTDINSYLLGVSASDDDHKYLICDLFKPTQNAPHLSRPTAPGQPVVIHNGTSTVHEDHSPLDHMSLQALRRAANRDMPDFLSTFAAGCSTSQWP